MIEDLKSIVTQISTYIVQAGASFHKLLSVDELVMLKLNKEGS